MSDSDQTVTVKIWSGYEPEGKPWKEFEVPILDWSGTRPPAGSGYVEEEFYRGMHQISCEAPFDVKLMVNQPDHADPNAFQSAINGGLQMDGETDALEQPPAGFELWGKCGFWAVKDE